MRLGIVITRAAVVDATWTTIALACAALARGHRVALIERSDVQIEASGRLSARAHTFEPPGPDAERLVRQLVSRTAERRFVDVSRLDVLLLRSAPMSSDLLTFAQIAQDRGVSVVNDPVGLTRVASKAWLASLTEVPTPATLVTRSPGSASVFYRSQRKGVVVKPSRGSGGRAVQRIPPGQQSRFDHAFATTLAAGGHVVVQAYLPAAGGGEKRVLWLDGNILGGYLRRRAPGEFRHNLKHGATAEPSTVTVAEKTAIAPLTPHLLAAGVRFAGLDLIGDHVVEVNAVNPGGTFHTDRLTGSTHADTVIQHLEHPAPLPASEDAPWALPVP